MSEYEVVAVVVETVELKRLGFEVIYVGGKNDGGIDIRARIRGIDFVFQCKNWERPIEIKQVSTLVPEEQYSANINASCEMNSEGNLEQIDSRYGNTSASDITDNTSNSDEPDEDKEIKEFLDRVHKENISNEIRERNRKKKLQSQQNTSNIQSEVNLVIGQAQNTEVKIPYNKRVEQNLRHDLFVFIKENNNKINNHKNIADLFILVIKISALSQKVSSEDIINGKDEPLPEEDVSVPDNSLDSNSESSDNENSYDENPYAFDDYHDNENDDE
ncbi:33222_t:CDS:2, partial [Gigaspora margarita]